MFGTILAETKEGLMLLVLLIVVKWVVGED